jgi:hypothetical protein
MTAAPGKHGDDPSKFWNFREMRARPERDES